MGMNEQLSQELGLMDKIDPASQAAAAYTSTGIDMSKVKRAMYEIQVGAISAGGTVDALIQASSDSAFTTPVTLTGTSITQITASNKRATIEVRSDQLVYSLPGKRYIRLQVTIGTNTVVFGATGWGGASIQNPASAYDISAVTQREVCSI